MRASERRRHVGFEVLGREAWNDGENWATVDVMFWSYHGERGALTIVEGNHTEDENDDIVHREENKRKNEKSGNCTNCTRYVSFAFRAEALVDLAKTILKTYDPNYVFKE
jgi:hypothetical protein